ncbi:MAG: helix-turn-helix domain-containing protein [Caulobacteraceae bacterium]|nr:helix-turn-helix domain-containing protein [Caulobacteraceae bacterium]
MKPWQFTTDVYPRRERPDAWREAMARLRLPIGRIPDAEHFHAQVTCQVSPMGVEFALVTTTPLEISGRNTDQPAAIWLSVLLDGEAVLKTDGGEIPIAPGDIVYGPTGVEATLRYKVRSRHLFITAPRVSLDHRLIAPLPRRIGHLSAAEGLNHIFSGLLRATADVLDDLTADQLRPVEIALTEFLVAVVAAGGGQISLGGAAGARASHLHRICQTIETMLSDPELTLAKVAEEDGVSPRYLQKLFASADDSFSRYLLARRLERCRGDLVSPLCAQLSISQICFRWGFNGSAHFSRAFRDRFGVSPRDYRKRGEAV